MKKVIHTVTPTKYKQSSGKGFSPVWSKHDEKKEFVSEKLIDLWTAGQK